MNYSSLTETKSVKDVFVSEIRVLEEKNMQFNGIDFDTYLKQYPDKNGLQEIL